jgi:predicted metal-dependent hydrolase
MDSPFVLSRWYHVAHETESLLRQHEELMQQRVELCRRRADLFRELLTTAKVFVEDVATVSSAVADGRQVARASTGTVSSSSRSR